MGRKSRAAWALFGALAFCVQTAAFAAGPRMLGSIDPPGAAGRMAATPSADGTRLLLSFSKTDPKSQRDTSYTRVCDVASGKPICEVKSDRPAALSPDGKLLAWIEPGPPGKPERLHLYSIDAKKDRYNYTQRPNISGVLFDATGERLLHSVPQSPDGGPNYGRLRCVSTTTGKVLWEIALNAPDGYCKVVPGPGNRLAIMTSAQPFTLYEGATGKPGVRLKLPTDQTIFSLRFIENGTRAVVQTTRQTLQLDTATGDVTHTTDDATQYGHRLTDSHWRVSAPQGDLEAEEMAEPTQRRRLRVGPRWCSSIIFDPQTRLAVSFEDGMGIGRVTVFAVPPVEDWPAAPPVVTATSRPRTPRVAVARELPRPTTFPADRAWWLSQATADLDLVDHAADRARVAWKLAAAEAQWGDLDKARALLKSANAAGTMPRAQWQYDDRALALYAVARGLAKTDPAAAQALLSDETETDRFFNDFLPQQALALGHIDGGRPDDAIAILRSMHGQAGSSVAATCAETLAGQGQFGRAVEVLQQMTPDTQRAQAATKVARLAVKAGQLDVALDLCRAMLELPRINFDGTFVVSQELAAAAETAGRSDVIDALNAIADPLVQDGVIRGRAAAMLAARKWDAFEHLFDASKPFDRYQRMRGLAGEIARSASEEQLIRLLLDEQGKTDWDSVVRGLIEVGKLDVAMKHLDEPSVSKEMRTGMRLRVAVALREAGRSKEADAIDPMPASNCPRAAERAIQSYRAGDRAAYDTALADMEKEAAPNPKRQNRRAVEPRVGVMLYVGDVEGAWAVYRDAQRDAADDRILKYETLEIYSRLYLAARRQKNDALAAEIAQAMEQRPERSGEVIAGLLGLLWRLPDPDAERQILFRHLQTPAGRAACALAEVRRMSAGLP